MHRFIKSLFVGCLLAVASVGGAMAASAAQYTDASLAAMEARGQACGVAFISDYVQGYGLYKWAKNSTATADGTYVVQCAGNTNGRMFWQGGSIVVPSIAQLEALPTPQSGWAVTVSGTQGGTFIFNASSTCTPDGGTCFAANDGTTGKWERHLIANTINFPMFGAVCDATMNSTTHAWSGTDDSIAIQDAYNSAYTNGYVIGPWKGLCGVTTTIYGKAPTAGINKSVSGIVSVAQITGPVLYFDANTYTNLVNSPLNLSAFSVYGSWGLSNTAGGSSDYVTDIAGNVNTIVNGMGFYDSRFMGLHIEYCHSAVVENSTAIEIVADQFNIVGCQHVVVHNNYCAHAEDNCISVHTQTAETVSPDKITIITDNRMVDTVGIALQGPQNTVITGNIGKRLKSVGIDLGLGFAGTQGYLTPFNITIADNEITDVINCYNICVRQGTVNSANCIQIDGFSTTQADTVPPSTYLYTNSSTATLGKTLNLDVHDNRCVESLPNVAAYSDWGYVDSWTPQGYMFTATGYINPAISSLIWNAQSSGIFATYGGLSNCQFHNNEYSGFAYWIQLPTNAFMDNCHFDNEHVSNIEYYGVGFIYNSGWSGYKSSSITNSYFDFDPYLQSANRNTTTHDWSVGTGNFPALLGSCCTTPTSIDNFIISGNHYDDLASPIGPDMTVIGVNEGNFINYNAGLGSYVQPIATGTSASGAISLDNPVGGVYAITTESLNTAAGSSYTLTWTNHSVVPYSVVQCSLQGSTGSGGAIGAISATYTSADTVTINIPNVGTTAFSSRVVTIYCTITSPGF
jgi:hypothetical protein